MQTVNNKVYEELHGLIWRDRKGSTESGRDLWKQAEGEALPRLFASLEKLAVVCGDRAE